MSHNKKKAKLIMENKLCVGDFDYIVCGEGGYWGDDTIVFAIKLNDICLCTTRVTSINTVATFSDKVYAYKLSQSLTAEEIENEETLSVGSCMDGMYFDVYKVSKTVVTPIHIHKTEVNLPWIDKLSADFYKAQKENTFINLVKQRYFVRDFDYVLHFKGVACNHVFALKLDGTCLYSQLLKITDIDNRNIEFIDTEYLFKLPRAFNKQEIEVKTIQDRAVMDGILCTVYKVTEDGVTKLWYTESAEEVDFIDRIQAAFMYLLKDKTWSSHLQDVIDFSQRETIEI
jgi:hypothetical protein